MLSTIIFEILKSSIFFKRQYFLEAYTLPGPELHAEECGESDKILDLPSLSFARIVSFLITVSFPVRNYSPEEFFGSTLSILIPLFFSQLS